MLVGGAKTRNPERRSIGERTTEVGRRGPVSRCRREDIDDSGRVISEKALGQYGVIRPAVRTPGGEEPRKLEGGLLTQSDEINRLSPGRPFPRAPSCRHLADDARQHPGGIFPADEVKTLERLIDEIERVSSVGVGAVRLRSQEEIRESSRRSAA